MDEPKPTFTDDELSYQKGQEAESYLRSIQEGDQYFLKLMSELEKELINTILGLRATDKESFTVYKAQLEGLYTPIQRVENDILIGKLAWARIQGIEPQKKGIL